MSEGKYVRSQSRTRNNREMQRNQRKDISKNNKLVKHGGSLRNKKSDVEVSVSTKRKAKIDRSSKNRDRASRKNTSVSSSDAKRVDSDSARRSDRKSKKRNVGSVDKPKAVRKNSANKSSVDVQPKHISLNERYLPAKNANFGCAYCKYYQYAPNARIEKWKGRKHEVLAMDGTPWVNRSHCVKGLGKSNAKIMFVGDFPGADEDAMREVFVSANGRILRNHILKAKLSLDDCYLTNVVKCRPPNNKTPTYKEAVYCSALLAREIRKIKPTIIVPLGKVALQAILGSPSAKITEAHGNPFEEVVAGHNCIVFPMWHPSYVLANDYLAKTYIQAFRKLKEVLKEGVVEKDAASYFVLTDYAKCKRVLTLMTKSTRPVAFDFESSGLEAFEKDMRLATISVANSTKKGYTIPLYYPHDVFRVPSEIEKLGWTYEEWMDIIRRTKKFLASPVPKKAHNASFDMKWSYSCLDVMPKNIVEDTMLTSYAYDENTSHTLKALAMKFTKMGAYDNNLDLYKAKHHIVGRYDLIPYKLLGKYATKDAVATLAISKAMKKVLKETEGQKIQNIAYNVLPRAATALAHVMANGTYVDLDYAKKLHKKLSDELDAAFSKLMSISIVRKFIRDNKKDNPKFEFSVDSPKQIQNLLFNRLKYTPLKPTKSTMRLPVDQQTPATDRETLAHFSSKKNCKICSTILDIRAAKKLIASFVEKLITAAEKNANGPYVHGNFSVSGTKTGRLSSSKPNLQNCVTKDTEVLTLDGWKPIYQVTENDCVMQWDNGKLTFVHPSRVVANSAYTQEMVEVLNTHIQSKTTAVHRCLFQDRKTNRFFEKEARNFAKDARVINAGLYEPKNELTGITKEFIQLVVATQADGSFVKHGGIDFSFSKQRKKDRLKKILKALGVKYTVGNYKRPGYMRFYVAKSALTDKVHEFLNFTNDNSVKLFDSKILSLSVTLLNVFCDEVMFWDGCYTRNNHYASKYEQNAIWVQTAFALTGRRARIRKYESYSGSVSWQVDVTQRDYSSTANAEIKHTTENVQTYCVTVPSSFFLARRNNCIFVTGNCPNKGGGSVKRMFVSRFGDDGCILQGDLSQIELRLTAIESRDRDMINNYRNNGDLHLLTTTKIFECTPEDWKSREQEGAASAKQQRTVAKRLNFGIIYGIGAEGIMNLLRSEGVYITYEEACAYIDKFYQSYPQVKTWIDSTHVSLETFGYLESRFGRRRRLPQVFSANNEMVARAKRQGTNFLIQSMASDIMLANTVLMNEWLLKKGLKSVPIITVHDSLVLDCLKSEVKIVAKALSTVMDNPFKFCPRVWGKDIDYSFLKTLPIKGDLDIGISYRDGAKYTIGDSINSVLAKSKEHAYDEDKWDERLVKESIYEFLEEEDKELDEELARINFRNRKANAA